MAATKVWKKFKKVEKIGLLVLCGVMLLTLGIGGSTVFSSCDGSVQAGSMVVDGETIEIDPIAYQQFVDRHVRLFRLLQRMRQGQFDNERIDNDWLERRFLLLQLARQAGYRIMDGTLADYIQNVPDFQSPETRKFSKDVYKRALEFLRFTSEAQFEEALREELEISLLQEDYRSTMGPTLPEIYERFKIRAKKYRVAYTWTDLAPFEEKVDPTSFTKEELEKFYATIDFEFQEPDRWQVEAAFVLIPEIDDEEFEALYERMVAEDPELKVAYVDGWNYFRGLDAEYSEANRRQLEKARDGGDEVPPDGDGEKPAEDEADEPEPGGGDEDDSGIRQEGGEDEAPANQPEPGEGTTDEAPVPEPGEAPVGEPGEAPAGEVPAAEPGAAPDATPPAEPQLTRKERYESYWSDFVRKEMFYRRLAGRVYDEAKDPEKSLAEIAEKYGFRYTKSNSIEKEKLKDLPFIGCPDLKFEVEKYTDESREGKVVSKVLPTANVASNILERGWQVVRIVDIDLKHAKPLADVEDVVRTRYTEKKVRDLALEEMNELKKALEAPDGDVAAILTTKGLPRRELFPFNASTPKPSATDEDLESEDEATREQARERALDAYVMERGYRDLRAMAPDKRFGNPLVDVRTQTAILIELIGKEDPGPEEMALEDIYRTRASMLQLEEMRVLTDALSLETLRKQFEFQPPAR